MTQKLWDEVTFPHNDTDVSYAAVTASAHCTELFSVGFSPGAAVSSGVGSMRVLSCSLQLIPKFGSHAGGK